MVQVIWASSPSTKGTARTLFTNRGGTAGPRECGETKGRFERQRERNGETQRQRQTHRKKNRDREMETETKRERETEADKQRWTQRKKQRRRWRQRCRQTEAQRLRGRHHDGPDPTPASQSPRLVRYSQPPLQLHPYAPKQGLYLHNAQGGAWAFPSGLTLHQDFAQRASIASSAGCKAHVLAGVSTSQVVQDECARAVGVFNEDVVRVHLHWLPIWKGGEGHHRGNTIGDKRLDLSGGHSHRVWRRKRPLSHNSQWTPCQGSSRPG